MEATGLIPTVLSGGGPDKEWVLSIDVNSVPEDVHKEFLDLKIKKMVDLDMYQRSIMEEF